MTRGYIAHHVTVEYAIFSPELHIMGIVTILLVLSFLNNLLLSSGSDDRSTSIVLMPSLPRNDIQSTNRVGVGLDG